jgi:membrane fusion protein (multidrug efflux system)
MVLVPLLAAGAILYFYLLGGRYESTDDAYVKSGRVDISTDVSGRVVELAVHDNQVVRRGDLLFRLDEAPYAIAVAEAEAKLAATRTQVASLKANYRQRQSEQTLAQETLKYRRSEFERQKRLLVSGIASQAQLDSAAHAYDEARAQIAGVEHEVDAVAAQLGGDPNVAPDQHPSVRQAQAVLDRAKLNLSYTVVRAPGDGIVTRVEQLQVGSYVNAAAPVFALVSNHDVWLEANFKEDQLAHMQVGQQASVRIDSYPGKVFEGRVVSLSPGTGSQFSVLPAENATGNWVKVVQRVPVRVELDAHDPQLALHAGLSATVEVDTRFKRHLFSADEQLSGRMTAANP